MFSDSGEWVGQGLQRLLHSGNAEIAVSPVTDVLVVQATPAEPTGRTMSFRFAAPDGQALAPGFYEHAERQGFQDPGRPGIDISGDGRGCGPIVGSFEIKELEKGASNAIERLWLIYEQHCDEDRPALFGEIRIGMPLSPGGGWGLPALVRWPANEVGRLSTSVPVTFVADSATTISAVEAAGPSATDLVVHDQCTGAMLGTGMSCRVWLRPANSRAGPASATLTLTEPGGSEHRVDLEGSVAATLTEVELVSDPLDWPGQGNSYLFTPDERIIKTWGDASAVRLLSRQHGVFVGWDATFAAPAGETLVPGTYMGATRYPSANGGPAMTVEAGYVCTTSVGEFTVHELSFDQFGDVDALDVTFEQHCNGDTVSGLRGSWRYQASDTAARDFTRLPEPTEPPLGEPAPPSRPPTGLLFPPRRPGSPQAPSGRPSLDVRDEAALLASRKRSVNRDTSLASGSRPGPLPLSGSLVAVSPT